MMLSLLLKHQTLLGQNVSPDIGRIEIITDKHDAAGGGAGIHWLYSFKRFFLDETTGFRQLKKFQFNL